LRGDRYARLSAGQHKDFCNQYNHARVAQADSLVDDILLIADDARNDWMKRNGENATGYQENGEVLRRSALRIDARKWLAGKMAPKKYGDKQQVEHSGPDGGPVTLEALITASLEKECPCIRQPRLAREPAEQPRLAARRPKSSS
jgi:hypothetical protein